MTRREDAGGPAGPARAGGSAVADRNLLFGVLALQRACPPPRLTPADSASSACTTAAVSSPTTARSKCSTSPGRAETAGAPGGRQSHLSRADVSSTLDADENARPLSRIIHPKF